MNYSQEHIFNEKALDYMINRVLQENNEKHKKIHDDLIRDINTLKSKCLDWEHNYSELREKYNDLEDKNKVLDKVNNELRSRLEVIEDDKV